MSDSDKIEQALALLELEQASSDRPALVIMPPDSKNFLIGNRGGFLKLAAAALKAAQGQKQIFKKETWFVVDDYDWDVAGLTPDEDAHIYLTKPESFVRKTLGYVLPVAVIVPFIVGLGTIVSWLLKWAHMN